MNWGKIAESAVIQELISHDQYVTTPEDLEMAAKERELQQNESVNPETQVEDLTPKIDYEVIVSVKVESGIMNITETTVDRDGEIIKTEILSTEAQENFDKMYQSFNSLIEESQDGVEALVKEIDIGDLKDEESEIGTEIVDFYFESAPEIPEETSENSDATSKEQSSVYDDASSIEQDDELEE